MLLSLMEKSLQGSYFLKIYLGYQQLLIHELSRTIDSFSINQLSFEEVLSLFNYRQQRSSIVRFALSVLLREALSQ